MIKKAKLQRAFSIFILILLTVFTVSCSKELANKTKKQGPPPRPPKAEEASVRIFPVLDNDYGSDDFKLYSPAVDKNGELLKKYKCEKKNNGIENSIPLAWENVPDSAKSLAIVMYHYPHHGDHNHVNSYLLLWGIEYPML